MSSSCPMGGAIELRAHQQADSDFPYPEGPRVRWLSSGRAALECILSSFPTRPARVWLPEYICATVEEPLRRLKLSIQRYGVDKNLHPLLPQGAATTDVLILVNYFGLTGRAVEQAARQAPCPIVVDATTAFYCPPLPGVPTFYSPRKFTGLADGGIAIAPFALKAEFPPDDGSDALTEQLLHSAHPDTVQRAEDALSAPPKLMGAHTRELMLATPWQQCAQRRKENYATLHRELRDINRLELPEAPEHAPMCYPLVCGIPGLRDSLIEAGIRLPLYWPEVIERTNALQTENRLARTLLPLPLDQRYSQADMERLLSLII